MCLQTAPENVNGLGTLDGDRELVPQRRGGMRKITLCQNLPGDNEVLSRDVYPKIVETSQVCRATVASKAEPCNFEPCRPATGSCNLFWTQLVASVDLSILVLYGHISAIRIHCVQHYSGNVVAETLSIHWYQTEGCCNNLSGMSLPNSSFFQSWVCRGTFGFYRWNTVNILANFVHMTIKEQVESNKTPRILGGFILGGMGESPMLMTMSSWRLVVSLVVMIMSYVLSSFNFNKLLAIHVLMSLMQVSNSDMAVCLDIESYGLYNIYSCVSSA